MRLSFFIVSSALLGAASIRAAPIAHSAAAGALLRPVNRSNGSETAGDPGSGTGSQLDSGSNSGQGSGSDTDPNTGSKSAAGSGSYSDAGNSSGLDDGAGTGSGTGSGSGSDPGLGSNSTGPASNGTTSSDSAGAASTSISLWQRPDRQRFGSDNGPFIAFQPDGDVQWYTVAGTGSATTIVASKVTSLPGTQTQTATVGGRPSGKDVNGKRID